MRIYDGRYSRYTRDTRRHNLAMRFISHGARTDTITRWTSLGAFRIRALVHTYVDETGPTSATRHRGAAPRKTSFFYKTPTHEVQSLALAICYQLESVIPKDPVRDAARAFPGLETGERLCNAFEAFTRTFPDPQITFEHATLLAVALASGEELTLDECQQCHGLLITNLLEQKNRLCVFCRMENKEREEAGQQT